jgi:hypothetical protein
MLPEEIVLFVSGEVDTLPGASGPTAVIAQSPASTVFVLVLWKLAWLSLFHCFLALTS